ncbi:tol-pal system YbgF family protein [Schlesneria sp. DSM 10557]|uniref:tetratricopeptide repeat protein n=1 Tax=Schlesneria sp. DSM 10557 TaxID=3044399 RepID=UPI0035A0772D
MSTVLTRMARPLIFGAIASLFLMTAAPLMAQDRVVIQQPGGSRFTITGYVEDYTGRELILKVRPNVRARHFPRAEIVEVTTEYTPRHEEARKLLAAGKADAANAEFTAALPKEDRPWVRREILAGQVRCSLWSGDYVTAMSRFSSIVQSDPETFHYGLVPLNWTDEVPAGRLRSEATRWMELSSTPLSRLVGASWLLTDAELGADAEKTLQRLAREADIAIQRRAQMQLWRVRLRGEVLVDPDEILRWHKAVEAYPTELRSGVYFVIGRAWQKRHEYERAARAYLWLPLVYDSDRWLSSRACYEAAVSLEKAGDPIQATNLYSEVVFRYGDTPYGPVAEKAWNALQGEKSAAP